MIGRMVGQRFARLATNAVVARPALWRLFRAPLRLQFDRLASEWDGFRSPGFLAAFEVALGDLTEPPARALDVGTGTGAGALAVAERFPEAEVVGVDIADAMLAEARRKLPPAAASRLRYEHADAAALAYPDDHFELVTLANMIPFFDELDRVLAPGGHAIFSFSAGPSTPIYVPPERLRRELGSRGFGDFREYAAGTGTAFVGRKAGSG